MAVEKSKVSWLGLNYRLTFLYKISYAHHEIISIYVFLFFILLRVDFSSGKPAFPIKSCINSGKIPSQYINKNILNNGMQM